MTALPPNVRDAWHLVALSRRVGDRAAVGVTVAGTAVALFRAGGAIRAVVDRCPHRNHPLAGGRVVDGALECPYHGWRFGPGGECVAVPGCEVPEGKGLRLGAKPVAAIERHGGVFVRLSAEGPDVPDLPPTLGDPGLDHFWWEQGTWKGTAFDAVENVLDPFHTKFIHDGFIRKRDAHVPVSLGVNTFGRGIEMVIEQTQPDLGLMSRFLERDRSLSRTRYYPPTAVQARWEGEKKLTLCVTAFFTPAADGAFTPFACFSTPRGVAPGWLKQAAIRLFLRPVVRQDRVALERQAEVVARHGATRYMEGPGDILGNRVHRLWAGEDIGTGSDPVVQAGL